MHIHTFVLPRRWPLTSTMSPSPSLFTRTSIAARTVSTRLTSRCFGHWHFFLRAQIHSKCANRMLWIAKIGINMEVKCGLFKVVNKAGQLWTPHNLSIQIHTLLPNMFTCVSIGTYLHLKLAGEELRNGRASKCHGVHRESKSYWPRSSHNFDPSIQMI